MYASATCLSLHTVSYVQLANMTVMHNGNRAISLSGYNNTIRNISVSGNGCGGIGMSGGDQVQPVIATVYIVHPSNPAAKPSIINNEVLAMLRGTKLGTMCIEQCCNLLWANGRHTASFSNTHHWYSNTTRSVYLLVFLSISAFSDKGRQSAHAVFFS